MSFQSFYETWFEQLKGMVHQLNQAPKPATNDQNHELHQQLVQKVMSHYSEYYRVKSLAAKNDILSVFYAPWCTSLERSLHWIAGWRPTTAFHLIYTESSVLFESHIIDILRGLRYGDLGDLSPDQLRRVSELQCQAVLEENAIAHELSEWQDGASEVIGLMGDIDAKMEGLVSVLERADKLRMKTIENLVQLLSPQQAVEFLIAAAHLQFGIRRWGINHDRQRGNL
ncbi:PREDICTED: protein DOG1-like 4 [Nicotiana attenuata]|uniref:Transcription factor tga1 n=1 Tax=Nicotiana attenuata TaxID=49451 RepID=A0A1J6II32_NICAT|nr:PREDICTED: protein DOG1-like 4 [Nicotiana attenuata]OIT00192.1 transcription factor tga1 [Nicotiana attenuata]